MASSVEMASAIIERFALRDDGRVPRDMLVTDFEPLRPPPLI